MKKLQCRIHPENMEKCTLQYYASIKVRVKHSDTGRETHQTWHLCKIHYNRFLNDKGENWYSWYKKKPFKIAEVIDYAIVGYVNA